MKKISRRNFLKVTAAGAVGAAALSLTGCGGSKDNGTTAGSTAASGAESKGYNLAAVDSSKTPKSFCGTTVAARPASCWSRP